MEASPRVRGTIIGSTGAPDDFSYSVQWDAGTISTHSEAEARRWCVAPVKCESDIDLRGRVVRAAVAGEPQRGYAVVLLAAASVSGVLFWRLRWDTHPAHRLDAVLPHYLSSAAVLAGTVRRDLVPDGVSQRATAAVAALAPDASDSSDPVFIQLVADHGQRVPSSKAGQSPQQSSRIPVAQVAPSAAETIPQPGFARRWSWQQRVRMVALADAELLREHPSAPSEAMVRALYACSGLSLQQAHAVLTWRHGTGPTCIVEFCTDRIARGGFCVGHADVHSPIPTRPCAAAGCALSTSATYCHEHSYLAPPPSAALAANRSSRSDLSRPVWLDAYAVDHERRVVESQTRSSGRSALASRHQRSFPGFAPRSQCQGL